jgi:hypothetical protein
MAITSISDVAISLIQGLRLPIQKASLAGMIAGVEGSLWRSIGFPAQGAVPAAAAICNAALLGALPLAARGSGQERVINFLAAQMATLGNTLLVEDRLGHMGGLNGTLLTAQTVNLDVSGSTDNLPERIGAADFSEVEWYLEWYAATGVTVSTPTAQVTFHDNTTGSVNIWNLGTTALPASVAASRRYKISPTNGKYIKSIQTVTLSASTGTVGSFGVTAVKRLSEFECTVVNILQSRDWSQIAFPKVPDNACIAFAMLCATTATGLLSGQIKQGAA